MLRQSSNFNFLYKHIFSVFQKGRRIFIFMLQINLKTKNSEMLKENSEKQKGIFDNLNNKENSNIRPN